MIALNIYNKNSQIKMNDAIVRFELSINKALVLFEFLSRFNKQEETPFEDDAESLVLIQIEAMLQRTLVEPFDKNYLAILQKARQSVRENY